MIHICMYIYINNNSLITEKDQKKTNKKHLQLYAVEDEAMQWNGLFAATAPREAVK